MSTNLNRGLKLNHAISIVVGTIIGTGVFLKTATMAQLLGSQSLVMTAWIVGGLLSLTGALAYAELGSIFPEAGGEYAYLKHGYGNLPAFLFGWMRFWIGSPGSIAAYAVGATTFLSSSYDLSFLGGKNKTAVILILLFSLINSFSVAISGRVQSFLTFLKFLMLIGLSAGVFFLSPSVMTEAPSAPTTVGFSAFGMALLASLWAYDGWNNLPMVAGEIENPKRNIPYSLIGGLIVIIVIYLLVNFSYFQALPLSEIQNSNSKLYPDALPVGTKAALTFLGNNGLIILTFCFILSALGAMNGSILTGARVPYAMAKDGLFFSTLARLHAKTAVPVVSILVQAVVASLLALSGTFDQLTDYVVFASWIFYALVTGLLFKLRKEKQTSTYQAPLFPVLPIVFILVSILLLINTLVNSPKESLIGLGIILAGLPCYFYFKKTSLSA